MRQYSITRKMLTFVLSCLLWLQPMLACAAPPMIIDPRAPIEYRPQLDQSSTNIPVVHITTPSASGTSHNQFEQYHVSPEGVILNNSATGGTAQLGGTVVANPNLSATAPANVILNEVTGSTSSTLEGLTEVFGSEAGVIVANPNGIDCNGCGFINTPRVNLTTGVPSTAGSSDAFIIDQGAISIGSSGLNASGVSQLELVGRQVVLDGKISNRADGEIKVIGGRGVYNYTSGTSTGALSNASTPEWVVDASNLGAMQSGQILVMGTEDGAGVRLDGRLYSQQQSITLSADSKLRIGNNVSSQQHVTISADHLEKRGDSFSFGDTTITTNTVDNEGRIEADLNLTIDNQGDFINIGGKLDAGVDMFLTLGGNSFNTGMIDIGRHLVVRSEGDIANDSVKILSNGTIDIVSKGSLLNHNSDLYGVGGVRLDTANVKHSGGAFLGSATSLDVKAIRDILNIDSEIRSDGIINLTAGGIIDNQRGLIIGASDINLVAGSIHNQSGLIDAAGALLLVATNGDIINDAGGIHAGNSLVMDSKAGSIFNRNGSITAINGITLHTAKDIDNTAGQIRSETSINIDTKGTLINHIGAITTTEQASIIAGAIDNSNGLIAAGENLLISSRGDLLNNEGSISGKSLSGFSVEGNLENILGNISAQEDIVATIRGHMNNSSGIIISNDVLDISVGADLLNADGGTLQSTTADVIIDAGSLSGQGGRLLAAESLEITTRVGDLSLSYGDVYAGDGLILSSQGHILNEEGFIQTPGSITLEAAKSLSNDRGIIVAGGAIDIDAASMTNRGNIRTDTLRGSSIEAGEDLHITTLTAGLISEDGNFFANETLDIHSATQFTLVRSNVRSIGALTLVSGDALDVNDAIITSNDLLSITAGGHASVAGVTITTPSDLLITVGSMSGVGAFMGADGRLSIESTNVASEGIDIAQSDLIANDEVTLTSKALVRNVDGLIQSKARINVRSEKTIDVSRSLLEANQGLDIQSASGAFQKLGGDIIASGLITINANDIFVDSNAVNIFEGNIISDDIITLTTGGGDMYLGGILHTNQSLILDSGVGSIFNREGSLTVMGDLTITAGGDMINDLGTILTDNALDATIGGTFGNELGTISTPGALSITAAAMQLGGGLITSGDTIALTTTAGDINHDGGTLFATDSITLASSGAIRNNQGSIQAENALMLTAISDISSRSGLLLANQALNITSSNGEISNRSGIIKSNHGSLTAQAITIDNRIQGRIEALGGNISLTTTGSLGGTTNTGGLAGFVQNRSSEILAGNDLTINATGGAGNTGGLMQAASGSVIINANTHSSYGYIPTSTVGRIYAGKDIHITTTEFIRQSGEYRATNGEIILDTAGYIDHFGISEALSITMRAGNNLLNDSVSVELIESNPNDLNSSHNEFHTPSDPARYGRIISTNALTLHAGDNLTNAGLLSTGSDLTLTTDRGFIANDAQSNMVIAGNLSATAAAEFINNGRIEVGNRADITGHYLNSIDGYLEAQSIYLTATAASADNISLWNDRGTINAASIIQVRGSGNTNNIQGTMRAATIDIINTHGTIINHAGNIVSNVTSFQSEEFDNRQGGNIHANDRLAIFTSSRRIRNSGGRLYGGNLLSLSSSEGIGNGVDGSMLSANHIVINAAADVGNPGGLIAAGSRIDITMGTNFNDSGIVRAPIITVNGQSYNGQAGGQGPEGQNSNGFNGAVIASTGTLNIDDNGNITTDGDLFITEAKTVNAVLGSSQGLLGRKILGQKALLTAASFGDIDDVSSRFYINLGNFVRLPRGLDSEILFNQDDSFLLRGTNFGPQSAVGIDNLTTRLAGAGINIPPIKFLADPQLEAQLLADSALVSLGSAFFFEDHQTSDEDRQKLYDNTIAFASQHDNLTLGVPIDETLIASLEEPMIWYITRDIEGQKALVPVVYMAANSNHLHLGDGAQMVADITDFQLTGAFENAGKLSSNTLIIDSASFINTGSVSTTDFSLTIDNDFMNLRRYDSAGINDMLASNQSFNSGVMDIAGIFDVESRNFINEGNINASDIFVTASEEFKNYGLMEADDTLSIHARVIHNHTDFIKSQEPGVDDQLISVGQLKGTNVRLEADETMFNTGSILINEGGSGFIKAGILHNSVSVGDIYNRQGEYIEELHHGKEQDVTIAKGHQVFEGSGIIQGGGDLTIVLRETLFNQGSISADGGNLFVSAKEIIQESHVGERVEHAKGWIGGERGRAVRNDQVLHKATLGGEQVTLIVEDGYHSIAGDIDAGLGGYQILAGATIDENGNPVFTNQEADIILDGKKVHYSNTASQLGFGFEGSQLLSSGGGLLIAGNTIRAHGSDIAAIEDVNVIARNQVDIDVFADSFQSYYKKGLTHKRVEHAVVHRPSEVRSLLGDVTIKTYEGDINVAGSQVAAFNHVMLDAGQDINLSAVTTEVHNVRRKLGFSGLSFGNTKTKWNEHNTSLASIVGDQVTLVAEGNITGVGAKLDAPGDILTHAKTGEVTFDSEVVEKYIESSGWSVGVSFFMSDMIDAALKGESLSDIVEAGIREDPLLNSLIDLAESDHGMDIAANATYTGIEAIRAADQLFGSNDATIGGEALTLEDKIRSRFGVGETYDVKDADGNIIKEGGDLNFIWSMHVGTFNSEQRWTESTPSQINAGGEVTVIAGTDINLIGGTVVKGEGINLFAENDVNILSNEDRYSSDSNNFGVRVDFAGLVPVGGGVSYAGSDSDGTKHTHASLDAGSGILTLQSGGNTTISGADILGRELDFDIAGDYYVGSVQNTFTSDSNAYSIGGSATSVSGSFASSEANRNFTDQVTSVIGTEKVDIKVGGHTHVKGSIIAQGYMDEEGQWNTEDNLLLQTSTISFEDIHDSDKSKSFSLGGSYGGLKGEGNTAIPGVVDGSYESAYKEGITKATIGGGEIIITDPEAQAELATEIVSTKTAIEAGEEVEQPELAKQFTNIEDLNRDVTDVQIITRDEETYIRTVVPIVDSGKLQSLAEQINELRNNAPEEVRTQITAVEQVMIDARKSGASDSEVRDLVNTFSRDIAINDRMQIVNNYYTERGQNVPPAVAQAVLDGMTPIVTDGNLTFSTNALGDVTYIPYRTGSGENEAYRETITGFIEERQLAPLHQSQELTAAQLPQTSNQTFLANLADYSMELEQKIHDFSESHPILTQYLASTVNISAQTVTGAVTGAIVAGPPGALAGGVSGFGSGVLDEVSGLAIDEVAGEDISEFITNRRDQLASGLRNLDQTLTDAQAESLANITIMGSMVTTNGAAGLRATQRAFSGGTSGGGVDMVTPSSSSSTNSNTGFSGHSGFELQNFSSQPVRNIPSNINGRNYSAHALDQMQNRGIPLTVVEDTLEHGVEFDTRPGTQGFYSPDNGTRVIINSNNGTVVTVIRGSSQ